MATQFFLFHSPPPKAAVSQIVVGGAKGAAPPEGEGNPTEGGCFASIYIKIYIHLMHIYIYIYIYSYIYIPPFARKTRGKFASIYYVSDASAALGIGGAWG